MREKTCCFTGHRELPIGKADEIQVRLEEELRYLIRQDVCDFMAGGALGFDTLAAGVVLKLKDEFEQLRLILVLPCPEQAQRWSQADIALYEETKLGADRVLYTADAYHPGCMQKRNKYLVEHSCCCICYMTKRKGGTKNTVDLCRKKGVQVTNIAV